MAFDESLEASRVHLVDADIAIELSADDGDSVLIKSKSSFISLTVGAIVDLSMISKLCLYGAETAELGILGFDDTTEIDTLVLHKQDVSEICAVKVKVKALSNDNAYLVVK